MTAEGGGNAEFAGAIFCQAKIGMTVHTSSVPAKNASVALIRSWPLTLLSGLFLPLLLSLGAWQLQRAAEKAELNAAIDTRLASQPQDPAKLKHLQAYTPVRLLGFYTDEYQLLDNRTRDGRVGYEVLQVFVAADQRWLVNRGWVEAPAQRDQLPAVSWPLAAKVITGFLYPVPAAADTANPPRDTRIQQLDRSITGSLELQSPQWSIRLSADSDTALVTDWQLINSPPQRHRAYAFQWFAMAAALIVLWLFAATRAPQLLRKK
ncbi:Cytochrome oxidase assembly protein ShyY1 [Microbulbifer donghaiensis]|uniref:SURF1-like protein n=1 Tax=Microbulbifer donghaiensis TaxID=494016 RepID=A0A1M5AVP7_9GAMM|nr:SURF1 family protein [Microbulbifer donghaiensis]SHF34351.1 Cytochrome oxidase assembly protein ShyY1 [Microbulbifer donghaiensis]